MEKEYKGKRVRDEKTEGMRVQGGAREGHMAGKAAWLVGLSGPWEDYLDHG